MSEIRSWDGMSGDIHFCKDAWKEDIPVRVVAWPEGAPKQEDVPHAGSLVRYKYKSESCLPSTIYTVRDGMPYLSSAGKWSLAMTSSRGSNCSSRIEGIEPYVPKPESTYTEEEIREAINSSFQAGDCLVGEVIIRKLRKK